MPPLTRWHIRAALIAFIAALLASALTALQAVAALPGFAVALTPVAIHLFMVGWVTQLIIGVAYWMFPKASADRPRGSDRLGWAVFWLLNVGLALRAVSEPLASSADAPWAGVALAISAVLQWLAGIGFVANTWNRVKA